MAIANSYPTVTPKITDLLIGTQTPDIDNDDDQATTKNFSVGDIINLVKFEPIPGTGTVTSINGSIDGDALSLSNLPITTAGTIGFNWQGDNLQYINGFGDLETFPTIPTAITLTTNGTAGASTLTNGVLNVPNYAAPVDPGVTSIVAGTNVTISPVGGTGAVTINATGGGGGGGTVTRVGAIDGTFISSVSADITAAGDLTYDLSATGTPNGATFLRGDNSWASVPNVITYNVFTAIVDWTASTSTFTVAQLFNNTGKTFVFTAPFVQNDYYITPSSNFADVDKVWLSITGASQNNRTYFPAAQVTASEVIFFIQESDTGNSIATDWSQLFVEIRIYP